jgi:protein-L-isoaspartate(D-aspartate) O-methyltransferase
VPEITCPIISYAAPEAVLACLLAYNRGQSTHLFSGTQMNYQQARSNMIEQQVRPWDVLDQRVLDVLADVPREEFVGLEHRTLAFSDYQLPIGFGQTMLKPILEGRLLQALQLSVTDSVLDIGTGSGYLAACLGRLAQNVESVEIHPTLAASATERLAGLGFSNVTITEQDAAEVWDARDSYDAIAFGGSVGAIPDFYKQKMAINGRLFAVVGDTQQPTMEALLLTRVSENEWTTESLFETTVDPLVNFSEVKSGFVF